MAKCEHSHKHRYHSEIYAFFMAVARTVHSGEAMHEYWCVKHQCWHIGHDDPRPLREARSKEVHGTHH